jgi:hypothetical protein
VAQAATLRVDGLSTTGLVDRVQAVRSLRPPGCRDRCED